MVTLFLTGNHELRIDLKDFENNMQFAKYKSFKIAGETEKYKLVLGDFLGGTAGRFWACLIPLIAQGKQAQPAEREDTLWRKQNKFLPGCHNWRDKCASKTQDQIYLQHLETQLQEGKTDRGNGEQESSPYALE